MKRAIIKAGLFFRSMAVLKILLYEIMHPLKKRISCRPFKFSPHAASQGDEVLILAVRFAANQQEAAITAYLGI